jgi:hypothetical protein
LKDHLFLILVKNINGYWYGFISWFKTKG